jgi:hypothetical protein
MLLMQQACNGKDNSNFHQRREKPEILKFTTIPKNGDLITFQVGSEVGQLTTLLFSIFGKHIFRSDSEAKNELVSSVAIIVALHESCRSQ